MNMLVKTNKIKNDLHRDAIAGDFSVDGISFDIRNLGKPEELFQVFDETLDPKYGILSTYMKKEGGKCHLYYLGKKKNTRFVEFRQKLQSLGYCSLKADSVHIYSKKEQDDYILVQLLLGFFASKNKKDVDIPYGHWLGGIYANKIPFTKKDNGRIAGLKIHGDTIVFLRIRYTEAKTITINVETWKPFIKNLLIKEKRLKKYKPVMELEPFGQYMIQVPWEKVKEKLEIWRKNPTDTSLFNNWYIQGTDIPDQKNSVAQYTLLPGERIADKLMFYVKFIQEVNEELGKYISLTPCEEEFERFSETNNKNLNIKKQRIADEIRENIWNKGITVCSFNNRRDDVEKAQILINTLISHFGVPKEKIQWASSPNPKTWNIQIIKNKNEFVDNKGNHDIFMDDYRTVDGVCLQHVVVDNIADKKEFFTELEIVLTELLIKDALIHYRVPNSMVPECTISIAISRKKKKENNDEKMSCDIHEYFAMEFGKDGIIKKAIAFADDEIVNSEFANDVLDKFDEIKIKNERKTLNVPEGIIRFDNGPFCGIYKTTKSPIPDYAKLLADYETKKHLPKLEVNEISQMLDAYNSINPSNAIRIQNAISLVKENLYSITDENNKVSVSGLYMLLQKSGISHTNIFYEDMEKNYPEKIIFQIHNKKEKNNPYEIDKLTGICYKNEESFTEYYVGLRKVGAAGKTKAIRCGLPVRIIENDNSFTFEEFARMLDVVWVRQGTMTSTVLPYPFKILNEYIKMEDNKKRMEKIADWRSNDTKR